MEMVTQAANPNGIGELAAALAKAQGEFPAVTKDRMAKLGTYSYAYADLASVLEAIRPTLSKHALALVQPLLWMDGHPWLITRLIHSSGQWVESHYPLGVYERPQEMGSAITYARRYAICALVGIAAEDDDDAAGAEQATERKRSTPATGPKLSCPRCGKAGSTVPSKYGGHYCFRCKKGFGGPSAEPGADEGAEAMSNKAQVPAPGTRGRTDARALAAECRRITGDDDAASDLLRELTGAASGVLIEPAQADAAWTKLEKHPVFGCGQ